MPDAVVALQKVSQTLSQAYNAWQASSFLSYFAARQQPSLTEQQRGMRLQLLRMTGQLVETEFADAMDQLTKAWQEYKQSLKA